MAIGEALTALMTAKEEYVPTASKEASLTAGLLLRDLSRALGGRLVEITKDGRSLLEFKLPQPDVGAVQLKRLNDLRVRVDVNSDGEVEIDKSALLQGIEKHLQKLQNRNREMDQFVPPTSTCAGILKSLVNEIDKAKGVNLN